jgi:hypothetical protein
MILWTLKENKDQFFYKKLGGRLSRKKKLMVINGKSFPLHAYIWEKPPGVEH